MMIRGSGSPSINAIMPQRAFATRLIDSRNMYVLSTYGKADNGLPDSRKSFDTVEMQVLCHFRTDRS